jgi:hypothetical protein
MVSRPLKLYHGYTYTFRRTDDGTNIDGSSNNVLHPFYISNTTPQQTYAISLDGSGSQTDGIIGNQSFKLTFTQSFLNNDKLSWYCTSHPEMTGEFTIIDAPEAIDLGDVEHSDIADEFGGWGEGIDTGADEFGGWGEGIEIGADLGAELGGGGGLGVEVEGVAGTSTAKAAEALHHADLMPELLLNNNGDPVSLFSTTAYVKNGLTLDQGYRFIKCNNGYTIIIREVKTYIGQLPKDNRFQGPADEIREHNTISNEIVDITETLNNIKHDFPPIFTCWPATLMVGYAGNYSVYAVPETNF